MTPLNRYDENGRVISDTSNRERESHLRDLLLVTVLVGSSLLAIYPFGKWVTGKYDLKKPDYVQIDSEKINYQD